MSELTMDIAHTALVLIDLQHSNISRDWAPYSSQEVLGNCVLLAQEMRQRGATVVYVRVLVNEIPAAQADVPMSAAGAAPPNASHIVPQAGVQASDIVVVKRQWGAFYGTDLELQLRRRNVKTLILGGIATNYGVESTARAAFDQGYHLLFAEDAMTGRSAEAHHFACQQTFRNMGKVRTTIELIEAMPPV